MLIWALLIFGASYSAHAQGGFAIGQSVVGEHGFSGETRAEVRARQANDKWHRGQAGGEDLTEPDGSVVAMVRKDHTGADKAKPWVGLAQVTPGGEDFREIGKFHTEREAKEALIEVENAQDAKDEE